MDDKDKVKLYRLVFDYKFLSEEIELDEVIKLVDESTTPVHIYESVTLWVGEEPLYKTFFHIEELEEFLITRAESKVENEGYLHKDGAMFVVAERDYDHALEDYNRMISDWAERWIKSYDVNKLWKKSDLLLPGNRCHNCKRSRRYDNLLLCNKETVNKGGPMVPNNFTCEKWERYNESM